MTRFFPIKPIYLAFLLILLYFCLLAESLLAGLLLGVSLIALCCHYERPLVFKTLLILGLLVAYLTYQRWEMHHMNQTAPSTVMHLQMIPDSLQINGDSLSFRGKADARLYQAFYTLTSAEEKAFFKTLDKTVRLGVTATVTEADEARNFKGFDYRKYLRSQKIYRIVQIKQLERISLVTRLSLWELLQQWRRLLIVHIDKTFPEPMSHYMTGLLLGYLAKDFDEMSDLYSRLGIIHLFALSGMQVGFFVGLCRWFLLRIGVRRDWLPWFLLPISIGYAGLTGGTVSVVRSLVQFNLATYHLRKSDQFALTVFLLLFLMPTFLLTAGGVLSFSYAFILMLVDGCHLSSNRRLLVELLSIHLGILPLLSFYFASFQPLAILLTALFSILFDKLILPGLFLILLLSPLVPLTLVNPFFIGLEMVLTQLGAFVGPPLIFGSPSPLILVLMLIVLGFIWEYYRKKRLVVGLSLLLAILFFVAKYPLENEVTMVDIGQGDSLVLRDYYGKTLLIDVGGRVAFTPKEPWRKRQVDSNAERTLIPYLRSRGVGRIDQLVLTHTDSDHIGDLEEVAKNFAIGEILVSQGSLTDEAFVTRLKDLKVKVRVLTAGDHLPIMGSRLQVLYPWEPGDGGNNDSLVLYGRLLDKNFLFTGDLEEGELELIQRYPDLPVDVLKAGHHGSKGSSHPEFLAHIGADVALISAGKNNRYQHPHQETLERFAKQNMLVYRTDTQGAVRFRGLRTWTVETVK